MRLAEALAGLTLGIATSVSPLHGQGTTTLSGAVLDSLASTPLDLVSILIEDLGISTITDETGEFSLSGITPGTHVLIIGRAGFVTRSFRFTLGPSSGGDLDIGYVLLFPRVESTVSITGVLTDSVTGSPVEFVAIGINGRIVTFTNERGAYRVDNVERGTIRLDARRIGYQPFAADIRLPPSDGIVEVDLELQPIAMQLPEIVVEGDRVIYSFGRMREFYRRREAGLGHYVTRSEIERRNPLLVSDLLRTVPGFRVTPAFGINHVTVRSCGAPAIYVDGLPLLNVQLDEFIFPEHVEAIEAYRGAFIPAEFMAYGTCGVVAIWTR